MAEMNMSERDQGLGGPQVEEDEGVFKASAVQIEPSRELEASREAQGRAPTSGGGEPPPPPKRAAQAKGPKIADRRELPSLVLLGFGFSLWALILIQCARVSESRVSAMSEDLARLSYETSLLKLDLTAEQVLGSPSAPLFPHLMSGLHKLSSLSPWALPEKLPELLWLLLGLIGVMKGAQLLYERRDLSWLGGGLYTLFAAELIINPQLTTWHVPLLTWIGVGLAGLWRSPTSKRWAVLAGLLTAQGVAASPLYSLIILYWSALLLAPSSVQIDGGARQSGLLTRVSRLILAYLGLAVGLAPWVLKGHFALPPLNYSRADELIMSAMSATQSGLGELSVAPWGWSAGLTLLAAFTWMSAHISGASWGRRGLGLAIYTALAALLGAQLIGEAPSVTTDSSAVLCLLPALTWVAIHPWSPIGSFVLLPFSPLLKRLTSFALFLLIIWTPLQRAYQHVFVRSLQGAQASTLERVERGYTRGELLALRAWFEQGGGEGRKLWVWGEEAWPLYALTGAVSPKAPPFLTKLSFDDQRLHEAIAALRESPVDLIVISTRHQSEVSAKFNKLLQDLYRRVPPSDYGWQELSGLQVYLFNQLRFTPRRGSRAATARKPVVNPRPSAPARAPSPPARQPSAAPIPPRPSAAKPERAVGGPAQPKSPLKEGLLPPPVKSGAQLGSPGIPVIAEVPPIPPRFAPKRSEGAEEAEAEAGQAAQAGEAPQDAEGGEPVEGGAEPSEPQSGEPASGGEGDSEGGE